MKNILVDLGFDAEDVDLFIGRLESYGKHKVEKIISLLYKYGCTKFFVKQLMSENVSVFSLDADMLEFKLEAIISNGDLIEDVLLDVI